MKTLAVFKKEMRLYFSSPIAYVVFAIFTLVAGWFFYNVFAFYALISMQSAMNPMMARDMSVTEGVVRPLFQNISVILLFLMPLLTMRLFAEERKLGTLELLWTFPVRDRQLLAGKFLAALAIYLGMLAATTIGPLILYALHPFSPAPVLAGYAGMVLLGTAFIACGTAASAVTESQVVAAMLTYGVLVFSWFATWNEAAIAARIAPLLLQLSLFDHFYGFAQGVIDSRDVVYLLAFAALFLFLALRALGARAWRGIG
jgi:ABC-2 type transport system permease protein